MGNSIKSFSQIYVHNIKISEIVEYIRFVKRLENSYHIFQIVEIFLFLYLYYMFDSFEYINIYILIILPILFFLLSLSFFFILVFHFKPYHSFERKYKFCINLYVINRKLKIHYEIRESTSRVVF